MIYVKKGSTYDFGCDMIVVPCNNTGGMTQHVVDALIKHGLPCCINSMRDKRCQFLKVEGHKFTYLAFAASVDIRDHNLLDAESTIRDIVKELVVFSNENGLHTLNIPLLGSGMGKLSADKSYQLIADGFADTGLEVNICVISRKSQNLLQKYLSNDRHLNLHSSSIKVETRLVFISYSHDEQTTCAWVEDIANFLLNKGIDVIVDMYNLYHGEELIEWMEEQIKRADKVLLICDNSYVNKANHNRGGTGTETQIIENERSRENQPKRKFIPVILNEDKRLPYYASNLFAFDWMNGINEVKKKNDLFDAIIEKDKKPKPGDKSSIVREREK